MSDEGGPFGIGAVVLRESFWKGDLRPILENAGDALRELVTVFGESRGSLDCKIESTVHEYVSSMHRI